MKRHQKLGKVILLAVVTISLLGMLIAPSLNDETYITQVLLPSGTDNDVTVNSPDSYLDKNVYTTNGRGQIVVLNGKSGLGCTQAGLNAGETYLVQTSKDKSEKVVADENGEIHTDVIKCDEIESITSTY